MRVGIDATSVLDEGTGVENHVLTVVDALARFTDHELVCFVRRRPPAAWSDLGSRLEVHALATGSQALATQVLLPRAARKAALDVLYCGGKPPPAAYHGPMLVGIHDAIPWEHPEFMGSRRAAVWFRSLYGIAVRRGCTVATVSNSSRDALGGAFAVPATGIRVIGNALAPWFQPLVADPDLPRPSVAPEGDYLLAVSRFDPRRGVTTLLDAWDLLRRDRPGLGLVLAGKVGWKVSPVIERARQTPGVTLTGEVDRTALAGLYRHATALVTASVYEGFGLPVLEAMAFGTPVVASAIPPHLELASGVGTFFPPGDAPALAAAVGGLLDDRDAHDRARMDGRERAAQFTCERLATEWTAAAQAASG